MTDTDLITAPSVADDQGAPKTKTRAGLSGMVLCVGIFIYLYHVTSRAVHDSLEHGSGEEFDMDDDVEPKSPGTPEHCDTTTSHAPSWLAESIEEFERAVE